MFLFQPEHFVSNDKVYTLCYVYCLPIIDMKKYNKVG